MKDSWENKSLDEITTLIKDGTHGTHLDTNVGIPLLSAKDIVNGQVLIPEGSRLISEKDFKQIHKNYNLEVDDIVLTLVGTIGRVGIIKDYTKKFTFQRSVGILKFKEVVDSKYAYYFISSEFFYRKLIRSMNASAQGGVYLGELGTLELNYPILLSQQKKIAQVLSTCDKVVEQTEAAITKCQALKQGMLHDLFTRGIDVSTGQLRPSYKDAPELYKETELGFVPKEWEVDNFDEATEIITDFTANGSFETLRNNVKYYYEKNYGRLIRLTDLRQNLETDGVFVDKHGFDFLSKSELRENDIMLANVGEYTGFACLMPKVDYKATIAPNMFLVRANNERFNSKYLYYFMTYPLFTNQVDNVSASSATKLLNKTNFRLMSVFKPNLIEQRTISEKLEKIDQKILIEQQTLAKYKKIKAGLMQDLLSGAVGVEELLEKQEN